MFVGNVPDRLTINEISLCSSAFNPDISRPSVVSKLIEHVGQRIYNQLKNEFKSCSKLEIQIVKLCPPINGDVDSVSISLSDFD
jgi:dihydroneopterin aldolase